MRFSLAFLLGFIATTYAYPKCGTDIRTSNGITDMVGWCSGDNFNSDAGCHVTDKEANCWRIIRYSEGKSESKECISTNWGTGNGKAKKGQCCKTNDDCKDTCNLFICGESW